MVNAFNYLWRQTALKSSWRLSSTFYNTMNVDIPGTNQKYLKIIKYLNLSKKLTYNSNVTYFNIFHIPFHCQAFYVKSLSQNHLLLPLKWQGHDENHEQPPLQVTCRTYNLSDVHIGVGYLYIRIC